MKNRARRRARYVVNSDRTKAFVEMFIRNLVEQPKGDDRGDRALRAASQEWGISFEEGLCLIQMAAPDHFADFMQCFFPGLDMPNPTLQVLGLERETQ